MEICYPDSNKVGKFNLPFKTLEDGTQRPMIAALFALVTVIGREEHESGRGVTFYAASELFQPLTEGEEVPEYRIEFACNMPFSDPEHEAKRTNSGPFGFVAIRNLIIRVPPATVAVKTPAPARH